VTILAIERGRVRVSALDVKPVLRSVGAR